jgi:hypothetical protein
VGKGQGRVLMYAYTAACVALGRIVGVIKCVTCCLVELLVASDKPGTWVRVDVCTYSCVHG